MTIFDCHPSALFSSERSEQKGQLVRKVFIKNMVLVIIKLSTYECLILNKAVWSEKLLISGFFDNEPSGSGLPFTTKVKGGFGTWTSDHFGERRLI